MADMNEHQARAAGLTRRISAHHQVCLVCRRLREGGGRVEYGPGGVRRVQCETERRLFAALAREQEAG